MLHLPSKPTRIALVSLDMFAAVTAIAGGAMLAIGLEDARFPADWLAGTPFDTYTIPGVILTGAVGGSAAIAAAAVWRRRRGGPMSILSGVVLLGWIVGEIAILNGRRSDMISPMEGLYLAVALAMIGLGVAMRGSSDGGSLTQAP